MSRFKAFSVIIHIAGWVLFMAFPLSFLNNHGKDNVGLSLLQKHSYWLFCYTYIFLFYSNAYFFIPEFFLKKKHVLYSIIVLLLLGGIYYLQPFERLLRSSENPITNQGPPFGQPPGGPPPDAFPDHETGHHPPPTANQQGINNGNTKHSFSIIKPLDITSLFIFFMIMALSAAIRTVRQWQLTEQRATRAEADKASAELSFLKAQINPHFLFNTLNNIYTLAVTRDDNAPDSIMKLSNIMRYVTDEVSTDFVPLQSEIDCISDYIELQRLRISNNTIINFIIEGDTDNKQIAPLVLMTFIENVFKYGISKHEITSIDINIRINDTDISFFCKNRIFTTRNKDQRTGIGIKNTQQRLAYLYPDRHLLNIWSENDQYSVQLILKT
jgi:hypothetical protein